MGVEVVGLVGGRLGTGGERAWSEKPAEPLWGRGVVVVGGQASSVSPQCLDPLSC